MGFWLGVALPAGFAWLGLLVGGAWEALQAGVVGWLLGAVIVQRKRLRELGGHVAADAPRKADAGDADRTSAAMPAEAESGPAAPASLSAAPPRSASVPDRASAESASRTPGDAQLPSSPPPPRTRGGGRGSSDADSLRRVVEAMPAWITGGNPVVKVGAVVLFLGVAFLVGYAAEHALLPIEVRLTGAALLGVLLLAAGIVYPSQPRARATCASASRTLRRPCRWRPSRYAVARKGGNPTLADARGARGR